MDRVKRIFNICVALVFLAFLGNTVSMLTFLVGRLCLHCLSFGTEIFAAFGNILKQNMLILALWVMVFNQLKGRNLQQMIYGCFVKMVN